MLTQARLKELLEYDPETGIFIWKKMFNFMKKKESGSIDKHGYLIITIDRKHYQASRLAFLWVTGTFPKQKAEHKDGKPLNNKWNNLRPATQRQNQQNKAVQSNNKLGLKGVVNNYPGRWRARIKVNGKQIHLGVFKSPTEAHLAYIAAATKYFGEFARAA